MTVAVFKGQLEDDVRRAVDARAFVKVVTLPCPFDMLPRFEARAKFVAERVIGFRIDLPPGFSALQVYPD